MDVEVDFRKLERGDLAKLLSLKRESFNTTHKTTIATLEDQNRWFDGLDNHPHTPRSLYLIAKLSKNYAGGGATGPFPSLGLIKFQNIDWLSRTADMGWDVFHEHRKKGYGKVIVASGVNHAFEFLNLRRLTAEILSNNPASRKCAEHAGFVQEGVKRKMIYKSDQFLDSIVYGILRQDWVDKKQRL